MAITAPVSGRVLPALPQALLDTTYAPPSGRTLAVPAGGDLQAALNSARPGDVIQLAAGAAYTGPFTLPAKSGTGWIVITSSATTLPPPGTRVAPGNASLMPKILGPQGSPAILTASGAHHYRFVGIEFAPVPRAVQHDLVYLGSGGGAWNFVFDRCYIHGDPNVGGTLWGLRMDAGWVGVVDSYLANFRDTSFEASAIRVITGAGPFKIQNNYIEAAGMSVIFGGQDPSVQGLISSDIEIRGNYMTKPLSWRIGDPTYAGTPWIVKNVLELKNAQRVLIDGNIFENNWRQADQDGFAIVFTPRNQNGGSPWSVVQDVTFTHNIVRHSTAGFHMLGWDYTNPSQQLRRVLIQNNLMTDIGAFAGNGGSVGTLYQMRDGVADATIDHNTAFQSGDPLHAQVVTGVPNTGLVFTNNIGDGNVTSDSAPDPASALSRSFPGAVFTANVLLDGTASAYPPGNFFPPGSTPVVNAFSGGSDYHLVPGSPYKNAGTDGRDIGADIDAINAATAGALPGVSVRSPQSVVWTDLVNALAVGTTLEQTGECVSGGLSAQQIAGNGYVEFPVSDPTGDYIVSLGDGTDLMGNWAVHIAGFTAEVREGNWTLKAHIPAAAGDVFRIAVVSGQVQYMKNRVVFYTSATLPQRFPLNAKATLWSFGATVGNAVIMSGG